MKFKTVRTLAAVALVGGLVVSAIPAVSSADPKTVSDKTFNANFTTMKYAEVVVAKGQGQDRGDPAGHVSSARYTEFDAPYLKAFRRGPDVQTVHHPERPGQ